MIVKESLLHPCIKYNEAEDSELIKEIVLARINPLVTVQKSADT